MDADLYDEFGNYIGPDLDSEEEEDEQSLYGQNDQQEDFDVSQAGYLPVVLMFFFPNFRMICLKMK